MTDLLRQNEHSGHLPEAVRELIREAHSESTRKAYQSDLRAFLKWGGSIPSSPEQLAGYLADQGDRLHPSTLSRHMVSLGAAHRRLAGVTNPTQHILVKTTLKGLRRKYGMSQKQASPLMLDDLWKILDGMGEGPKCQRDKSLLLIGFAGGLRRSEIVSLNIDDLEFIREGLILTIRKSKTDQEAIGRRIGIPFARGRWCPVLELLAWLELNETKCGPVFRSVRKGGAVQHNLLSGEAVSILIKKYVSAIGLNPTSYSGHSIRAGFVTSAAKAGIPNHLIRAQTGHASDVSMSRYIREGEMFEGNAAGRLL